MLIDILILNLRLQPFSLPVLIFVGHGGWMGWDEGWS